MDVVELRDYLNAVIDGNQNAKNCDVFVSIDWGNGKKSCLYEIYETYSLSDDAQVLIVKAWRQ